MDLDLTKSQFNILLQAITQVSTQVDDLRAEMRRDFLSKKDFKKEMKKYVTKEDLKKFATKEEFKKELSSYPTKEYLHKQLKQELKSAKDEIIEEVIGAIQPSIATLEDIVEKHDKALKTTGLLR